MISQKESRTMGKNVTINRNVSTKLSDVAKSATSSIKHQGTPNDEVLLKPVRVGCPFCKIDARPKAYDNLWKLRIHFQRDHGFTYSCQNLMATLENLVERKVIL
jgi:hypothetical protein|tara:strand:- start:63 stop:374 length:312 start_codon:yes stop_codon:yes gene_type:complete